MKRLFLILSIISFVIFIQGCSYSVFMNSFPHLRNIQIGTFDNETPEYTLAQDVQEHLVNSFQRDGRLRITTIDPDSFIEGTVLDYLNEISSYDIFGNVTEYRVSILLSVTFTDLRHNEVIYDNRTLRLSETYSPNSDNPELFTTEEQARQRIFERVFETIIRSTLEAW